MSYYLAQAEQQMRRAGGDPANAGPLADWARAHASDDDPLSGVIVGEDGTILAETVHDQDYPHAHRVTAEAKARWGLTATEAGMARGAISRAAGQPAIWVRRSELTRGASAHITGAMSAADFRGIREACGLSIVDLTGILQVSRSIIQKWEAGDRPVVHGVAEEMRGVLDRYLHAVDTGDVAGLTERQVRQVRTLHGLVSTGG